MQRRNVLAALALGAAALLAAAPAASAATSPSASAPPVVKAAASCPTNAGGPVENAVDTANVTVAGCDGYLVASVSGQVSAFGAAASYGDMSGKHLNAPIVGIASTPDGRGYYLLGADGGIFDFGDAGFFGSMGSHHLNAPVVAMAVTRTGLGYWEVAKDGGIFGFGDAGFFGSTGSVHLNQPVDGMAPSSDGKGYTLVASDGGVFQFGDSRFFGSLGATHLNKPVVGIYPTSDGAGYTLVASDGGVFTFGTARFYGSLGANPPPYPVVGLSPTADNGGYTIVDQYGQVFTFGDARYFGSAACPINSVASYGADPNLMVDTGGGTQLMTVVGAYYGNVDATYTAWTRQTSGCWSPASLPGQPAMPYVAEVGLATDGSGANLRDHRHEGDGTTPTGIYAFESTLYGNNPLDPNPAYAYHHFVCGDWWDENPTSAQYNQFVHVNSCSTVSPWGDPDSEALWTETDAYQHFAVINFNPPPTNNPIGSGIFLHDDTSLGFSAGCLALPPSELDAVLAWMSPGANPHVAIGVPAEMPGL